MLSNPQTSPFWSGVGKEIIDVLIVDLIKAEF